MEETLIEMLINHILLGTPLSREPLPPIILLVIAYAHQSCPSTPSTFPAKQ